VVVLTALAVLVGDAAVLARPGPRAAPPPVAAAPVTMTTTAPTIAPTITTAAAAAAPAPTTTRPPATTTTTTTVRPTTTTTTTTALPTTTTAAPALAAVTTICQPRPAPAPPVSWLPADLPFPPGTYTVSEVPPAPGDPFRKAFLAVPTTLAGFVSFIGANWPAHGWALGRGDAEAGEVDDAFRRSATEGGAFRATSPWCDTGWSQVYLLLTS
jgi:hypothetical protein